MSVTKKRYFKSLFVHCRGKPDAVEDHPWGDTVFKVGGKIFAFLGSPDRPGVTVKALPEELDFLLGQPFVRRASYVGRFGWVNVTVESKDALGLALGLIDDSYDLIVSKRPKAKTPRRPRENLAGKGS